MESQYTQANAKLKTVYQKWIDELKKNAPVLLDDQYSNPYFISVPDDWFDSEARILVVGEEGFGTWGCGKENNEIALDEIERIQNLNYQFLGKQLGRIALGPEDKKNNSPFWKRLRRVAQHGICAWTNIDKIHVLHSRKCSLHKKDRALLHSLSTKLLAEEIDILQPTHIVFFGWYGISLQAQLPEVFEKMYPAGLGNSPVWHQRIVSFDMDGRHYLFSYHPSWGYRHPGYEDAVISELNKQLKKADIKHKGGIPAIQNTARHPAQAGSSLHIQAQQQSSTQPQKR